MGSACSCCSKFAVVAAVEQPERPAPPAAQPTAPPAATEEYVEDPASSLPRLAAWATSSGARGLSREVDQRPYQELLALAAKDGSVPAAAVAAIDNDVPRTFFPGMSPPSTSEVQVLGRLLRALALWDPEVAYCQGINFLAFFALAAAKQGVKEDCPCMEEPVQDEQDAFWLVGCILRDYGARGLFLPKTPVLKLYGFCLSRLLEKRLPEFHRTLCGLDAVLGFKWFGTLFTTVLPREAALRAWDVILRDGMSSLLALALGLCALIAPALTAALQDDYEAPEFLGLLQRQLPTDPTPLLPAGFVPARGREVEHRARKAGQCLVEAAEQQRCSLEELGALLDLWRQECPADASDLPEDFAWSYLI